MSTTLGMRLKNLREHRGWSQIFIGKKLNIPNTTISGYERDYREPDFETLIKFSKLYEVSIDYLLTGNESDLPEHDQEDLDGLNDFFDYTIQITLKHLIDSNGNFFEEVIPFLENELPSVLPNIELEITPGYLLKTVLALKDSDLILKQNIESILTNATYQTRVKTSISQLIDNLLESNVKIEEIEKWLQMMLDLRTKGAN